MPPRTHQSVAPRCKGGRQPAKLPIAASPIVTAGLRWAPSQPSDRIDRHRRRDPQPTVMTIQPLFWPFVLLSTTLATTPSPSRTRIIMLTAPPKNSAWCGILAYAREPSPVGPLRLWGQISNLRKRHRVSTGVRSRNSNAPSSGIRGVVRGQISNFQPPPLATVLENQIWTPARYLTHPGKPGPATLDAIPPRRRAGIH